MHLFVFKEGLERETFMRAIVHICHVNREDCQTYSRGYYDFPSQLEVTSIIIISYTYVILIYIYLSLFIVNGQGEFSEMIFEGRTE